MNTPTSTLFALVFLSFAHACSVDSAGLAGRRDASHPVDSGDFVDGDDPVDGYDPVDGGDPVDGAPEADTVSVPTLRIVSNSPLRDALNVVLDSAVVATFSEGMDPATLNADTFTVTTGDVPIAGSIVYFDFAAFFQPRELLDVDAIYTATITTGATSALGVALSADHSWSFTSGDATNFTLPVDLATAGDFVILAKTAITNVPTSEITGDLGVSPTAASAITGFALSADPSNEFSTTPEVTGRVYAADYNVPTPEKMRVAVLDMEQAYLAAEGRATDVNELGAGDIGGRTLAPGVYSWSTALVIPTDLILHGSATDVWIFQVSGAFTLNGGASIVLSGGARSQNIFWQISGAVGIETLAHSEGVFLTATSVTLGIGASVSGRLLAQTAVTLAGNVITEPEL